MKKFILFITFIIICISSYSTKTNYRIDAATYVGDNNEQNYPVAVGVGEDYKIFVAGNFGDNIQGIFDPAFSSVALNGTSGTERGKIIILNKYSDTIKTVVTLGNTIYDFEIQNHGDYRMVVTGEWGVTVLDSSGKNVVYTKTQSELTGAG